MIESKRKLTWRLLNRLQKGQRFSSPFGDNGNAVACRCCKQNQTVNKGKFEEPNSQLTACGRDLGKVAIRRGISQRDSLSPLLFVISMLPLSCICMLRDFGADISWGKEEGNVNHLNVQTVRVFSSDISTDSGI